MNGIVTFVENEMNRLDYKFKSKPILIGGQAMEFYGLRKSGKDIDFVITDEDYQCLKKRYPERKRDLYGDLGVMKGPFEIWRSIALLDYSFFSKDAAAFNKIKVISMDRLALSRVFAMEVEKYKKDLTLIPAYYYDNFRNSEFLKEAEIHRRAYEKFGGNILQDNYQE